MLLALVQVAAMAELYTGDHNAAALLDNLDEITSLPTEFLNIGHLLIVRYYLVFDFFGLNKVL